MVKLICLVSMFLCVSYIGVASSANFSKKEKFFNEVLMFISILSTNIKFNKTKLASVINGNITNFKTEFKDYLIDFLNGKTRSVSILTKYENEKLNAFFLSVGKFNVEGELNNIETYKQIFLDFYNKSSLNNKKYGSLYSKLGIMFGLILVIVFI